MYATPATRRVRMMAAGIRFGLRSSLARCGGCCTRLAFRAGSARTLGICQFSGLRVEPASSRGDRPDCNRRRKRDGDSPGTIILLRRTLGVSPGDIVGVQGLKFKSAVPSAAWDGNLSTRKGTNRVELSPPGSNPIRRC